MLSFVKFYADWCAPCNSMKETLELFKAENKNIAFSDVNINNNPQLAKEHHVRNIPTFLIFKNAIEIGRKSGAMSMEELTGWVNEFRDIQPEILPAAPGGVPGARHIVLRNVSAQENSEEGSS